MTLVCLPCHRDQSALVTFTRAKGFTLLELLVVLVLMGLSMSLALPSLFKWHDANMREAELAKFRQLTQTLDDRAFLSNRRLTLSLEKTEARLTDGENSTRFVFNYLNFPKQTVTFNPSGTMSESQLIAEAGAWRVEIEL